MGNSDLWPFSAQILSARKHLQCRHLLLKVGTELLVNKPYSISGNPRAAEITSLIQNHQNLLKNPNIVSHETTY
jgi:hypothetical protein